MHTDTTTIRVSEKTRATLRNLARDSGEPIQAVAEKAVELYRRQRLLEQTNAAYAQLRSDPAERRALDDEWATLDGTLMDGLED